VIRVKRKNRNGAGSPARLRKDSRYEDRATLNTTTGRRWVSFYEATVKEAEDERVQALADTTEPSGFIGIFRISLTAPFPTILLSL
jgi:hypothetical protein